MRILFVDDVADTRFIFRTVLEMASHEVRMAADGAQAVEAVEKEKFDVIIMDLAMPDMDGWDATAAIRRLPNGEKVPIIIFTAHHRRGYETRATQAGADYILQKPMMPTEMVKFLENNIAKSKTD